MVIPRQLKGPGNNIRMKQEILCTRARFKDSVDFIGWYINKTSKIQEFQTYSKDKKAIIYAKSVKELASKYRKQLSLCKKNLDKKKYIIF